MCYRKYIKSVQFIAMCILVWFIVFLLTGTKLYTANSNPSHPTSKIITPGTTPPTPRPNPSTRGTTSKPETISPGITSTPRTKTPITPASSFETPPTTSESSRPKHVFNFVEKLPRILRHLITKQNHTDAVSQTNKRNLGTIEFSDSNYNYIQTNESFAELGRKSFNVEKFVCVYDNNEIQLSLEEDLTIHGRITNHSKPVGSFAVTLANITSTSILVDNKPITKISYQSIAYTLTTNADANEDLVSIRSLKNISISSIQSIIHSRHSALLAPCTTPIETMHQIRQYTITDEPVPSADSIPCRIHQITPKSWPILKSLRLISQNPNKLQLIAENFSLSVNYTLSYGQYHSPGWMDLLIDIVNVTITSTTINVIYICKDFTDPHTAGTKILVLNELKTATEYLIAKSFTETADATK